MKIKDLVEKLARFNPDAEVMIMQAVPDSQHYSKNGEKEYELSAAFKVVFVTENWIELV